MESDNEIRDIGEMIRHKRGGRTISSVAREIGVGIQTVSRVENGKNPDLKNFAKMCRWLKEDPAYILNVDVVKIRRKVSDNHIWQRFFGVGN